MLLAWLNFSDKLFCYFVTYIYIYNWVPKRGLPHAHILLTSAADNKLVTPYDIDDIICDEIPDPNTEPEAYETAIRCMMPGPCRYLDPKCVSMINGKYSKNQPKAFANDIMINTDGYRTYRTWNDGKTIKIGNVILNNR